MLAQNLVAFTPPSFEQVRLDFRPSDEFLLDDKGQVIDKFRRDLKVRKFEWTSLSLVSQNVLFYLLDAEDKRFFEHSGIDYKAMTKAVVERLFQGRQLRGASTLSMQLCTILENKRLGRKKSFGEKWDQVKCALSLEQTWTKDQILEAYLNLVPLRGEIVGIHAAAQSFFRKDPSALLPKEASFIVALIKSPNAKAQAIGLSMCRQFPEENCAVILKFAQDQVQKNSAFVNKKNLLSFVDKSILKQDHSSVRFQATIDSDLQKKAMTTLKEHLNHLRRQNVSDAAILMIDNKTKAIKVYVANSGESFSNSAKFDHIKSKRQAGSTLKPVIYGLGIDLGYLKIDSLFDDAPLNISLGNGLIYNPRNFDEHFRGVVSLEKAMASSLNVPAVLAYKLVGPDRVVQLLKNAGVQNLADADYYGPSLALGSVDVSLWELVFLYRDIFYGNHFKKETRELLFDALSKAENRIYSFGLESVLNTKFKTAIKTGTSKDMRDNWCIGVNEKYTIGVWVGNSSGASMWNVSGVSGAAPILKVLSDFSMSKVMNKNMFAKNQKTPAVLKNRKSTEAITNSTILKIHYPVDQSIFAIDPEIPLESQKILIQLSNQDLSHALYLNDEKIEKVNGNYWINLNQRGKFKLTLKDFEQNVIDKVYFIVR